MDKLLYLLACIGAMFLAMWIIGSLEGYAFHMYFGTSEGVVEWHEQEFDRLRHKWKVE